MFKRNLYIFFKVFPFIFYILITQKRFIIFGKRRDLSNAYHVKVARWMTSLIASLGPTFIKLAQVISTRADFLPQQYLAQLATLQDEVPPVPFKLIKPIIEKDFGNKPIKEIFEEFNEEPFAAASVAQVYKAVYKGKQVIVKVIRPDIEKNVSSDIYTLKNVLNSLRIFFPDNKSLLSISVVLKEFEITIYEEMDLLHEVKNIKEFQEFSKKLKWIVIPNVYTELNSKNVLVMDFYKGVKITDLESLKKNNLDPKVVLDRLIEFYIYQSLIQGVIHADPHPGNILVDDKGRIVLLDYGLVVHISDETKENLIKAVLAGIKQNIPGIIDAYYALGIINKEVSRQLLEKAAGRLYQVLSQKDISSRKIQDIINDIMKSFYAFPFELPQNLVYIFKTAAVLEGIGTAIDPSYNLVKDIVPVAKKYISHTPLGKKTTASGIIKTVFNEVKQFVMDTKRVMHAAYEEDFRVKIHPENISGLENFLIHVIKRLTMALIGGFIGLIAALIFIEDKNPYLLAGGLFAAFAVIFVAVSMPIKTTYGYSTLLDVFRHRR
ncbi:MAG: AarF/ABC1/UbiB kinase family protein [Candidatus Acididesulfobacter guangdongensis]|uniref:AarF/ABC1/UbiB kinase family protein n=1 Tax=Acididesulfobacter guangdongensis TaxID=2597225 RepID=A0A519BGM5_ACIG2|nr:MAG: AarF/ABC1/UbiB kinase family protein [Candidatus Acididesulfobacter guangdongensis]